MDEDVTKLTDEELQARINGEQPEETAEEVAESPDTEAPEEEAQPEPEQVEEPEPQKEEPEATQPEEEQRPPSRRETLRIQQILAKREAEAPQQPSRPTRQDALDYSKELDADPEVIQRLDEDRRAEGQAQYNLGLETAKAIEFRTNIKLDLPLVKDKMEKLDPRDAESIDKEYLLMVGFDPQTGFVQNPNIGYADFVEARLEQAERLAASMTAQTTKNIAKQAAQTGLRPDGSTASPLNLNKDPASMTNEELEAVIKKAGLATQKY